MDLVALALGFAVAGALASGYQALLQSAPRWELLNQPEKLRAAAAVPFLVFAAPFLILRNALCGKLMAHRRVAFVVIATLFSGFWSLMSGTAFIALLRATGLLA